MPFSFSSAKMPKPNTDVTSISPNAIQVSEHKEFKNEVKIQKLDHMAEFTRSLTVDARAAIALGQCLDMNAAKKFIEIIERCDGTLITSGIGKNIIRIMIIKSHLYMLKTSAVQGPVKLKEKKEKKANYIKWRFSLKGLKPRNLLVKHIINFAIFCFIFA